MNMRSIFALFRFIWKHPLNQGHRLAALARLIRWQLGSRLLPGAVEVPLIGSVRMRMERGMAGATGNYYCGLHEHQEMAFVLHVLREADVFVDVGANIGSYSLLAVGGPGARAISIEPVPSAFHKLELNALVNGFGGRMQCLQSGVSSTQGTIAFTHGLDTMNHVAVVGEDADTIDVKVTTLDAILPNRDATVIKIDVEGHEQAVLAGAGGVLASPSVLAVIMETNSSGRRYGLDDHDLFVRMRSFGFQPYQYDPFERTLIASSTGESNTIFIRDLEAVQLRVRNAPRFQLVNSQI